MSQLGWDSAIRSNYYAGWGTATDGQVWTQAGYADTAQLINDILLLIGIDSTNTRTYQLLGTTTPSDINVLSEMTCSSGNTVGILVHYTDGNNNVYAQATGTTLSLIKKVSGTTTTVSSATITFIAGNKYWMRLRVVGTTYSVKWWADGSAEPGSWNIYGQSITDSILASGQFGCTARMAATNTTCSIFSFFAVDYLLTDSVTVSDSSTVNGLGFASAESVTVMDSLPTFFPADTLTIDDSASSELLTLLAIETLALLETPAYALTFFPLDALSLDDSASTFSFAPIFPADSGLIGDGLLALIAPFTTDTLTLSETSSESLALSSSDSILILGSSTLLETFTEKLTTLFADSSVVSDALSPAFLWTPGADIGTLSDVLLATNVLTPASDIAGTVAESLAWLLAFVPGESASVQELLAASFALTFASESGSSGDLLLSTLTTLGSDAPGAPIDTLFEVLLWQPQEMLAAQDILLSTSALTFPTDGSGAAISEFLAWGLFALIPADTLTIDDSASTSALVFSSTQNVPILDTLIETLTVVEQESVSLLDALIELLSFVPQELLTTQESLLSTLAESLPESAIPVSDTLLSTVVLGTSDALTLSDSLFEVLAFLPQDAPIVQEVLLSSISLSFASDLAGTLVDALINGLNVVGSESVSVQETLFEAVALTFSEQAVLSESLLATDVLPLLTDSLTLSDSASLFALTALPASATLNALDTTALLFTFVPQEGGTVQDALAASFALAFAADSSTLTDLLLATEQVLATDLLSLLTESGTLSLTFVPQEGGTLLESLAWLLTLSLTPDSAVAQADALLAILSFVPTEGVSLQDALILAQAFVPGEQNTITESLLDSLALLFPAESGVLADEGTSGLTLVAQDALSSLQETLALLGVLLSSDALSSLEILFAALGESGVESLTILDSTYFTVSPNSMVELDQLTVLEGVLYALSERITEPVLTVTETLSYQTAVFALAYAYVRSGTQTATTRDGSTSGTTRDGTLAIFAR